MYVIGRGDGRVKQSGPESAAPHHHATERRTSHHRFVPVGSRPKPKPGPELPSTLSSRSIYRLIARPKVALRCIERVVGGPWVLEGQPDAEDDPVAEMMPRSINQLTPRSIANTNQLTHPRHTRGIIEK